MEAKFGTRGIKPLNKNDYDNVIKKLKSLGFTSINEVGTSSLKMQCEYLDKNTGKFKLSNTRVTINDLFVIQKSEKLLKYFLEEQNYSQCPQRQPSNVSNSSSTGGFQIIRTYP